LLPAAEDWKFGAHLMVCLCFLACVSQRHEP